MDQWTLSQAIEGLYTSALEEDALRKVAEKMRRIFSSNLGFVGRFDISSAQQTTVSAGGSPTMDAEYAQFGPGTPLTRVMLSGCGDSPYLDTDLSADARRLYTTAPVVREFFAPREMDKAILAPLTVAGDSVTYIGVRRGGGGGHYREDDRMMFSLLAPHVRQIAHIQTCLGEAESLKHALARSMDLLGAGVFLINDERRLLHMNRRAEQLVQERDGISITKGGILVASIRDSNAALQRALRDVARTDVAPAEQTGCVLRLERPNGRRPLSVLISPVNEPMAGALSIAHPRATAILFVRDPDADLDVAREDVAALCGVSTREAEVIVGLLHGRTIKEVARQMGLTENSARQYVKNILTKTGARSQHDLVGRVFAALPAR
ncbi:MAG: LuxR C-terminal-related transcriptional regulator [Marivibrio sp.]|uniref:helix-turn-helix transcriptional regulator n=1 Tax=Marivibrio sp. TaxID=2039719 RepID=UPI0032EE96F2